MQPEFSIIQLFSAKIGSKQSLNTTTRGSVRFELWSNKSPANHCLNHYCRCSILHIFFTSFGSTPVGLDQYGKFHCFHISSLLNNFPVALYFLSPSVVSPNSFPCDMPPRVTLDGYSWSFEGMENRSNHSHSPWWLEQNNRSRSEVVWFHLVGSE